MRTNLTHFVAAIMRGKLCIIAAAIALLPVIGWSQEYTVTDLGTLGNPESVATSVNDKGQVVGTLNTDDLDGDQYAFLYANGAMTNLAGFPNSPYNVPYAINDNGVAVGVSTPADANNEAALWGIGPVQDLTPGEWGYAVAINANNTAVGYDGWFIKDVTERSVIFSGGQVTQIPLGNYVEVDPTGINSSGEISAQCVTSGYTFEGCLITGNKSQILKRAPGYTGAMPLAINSSGDTCGMSYTGIEIQPTTSTATYWKGINPTNLGTLANTSSSSCLGMDNYGYGVGTALSKTDGQIGMIYDPVNGARNLNTLIPHFFRRGAAFRIQNAVSISETGFIAANCLYEDGDNHACLLTPNLVLIFRDNILNLAETERECTECEGELVSEARSLPKSVDGLSGDERERVASTVKLIGEQIERLEREGKISESKAMLLLHDAGLVLAAVEPLTRISHRRIVDLGELGRRK